MIDQPTAPLPELVGSWRKADAPSCADRYPELLTFAVGTYRGGRGATQGFIWWDAGSYRIEKGSTLVLSVANDDLEPYEYNLNGDVLLVTDTDGCRFAYHRVPPNRAV